MREETESLEKVCEREGETYLWRGELQRRPRKRAREEKGERKRVRKGEEDRGGKKAVALKIDPAHK